MPTIEEINKDSGQGLGFDFPATWQAVKYDQQEDAATNEPAGFYRRVIQSEGVKHIRGMDIVCRLPDETPRLQLIEIKDDRKRQANKAPGDRHTELYETVLSKTMGTLAGLTLAERLGDDSLRPMACLSRLPQLEVVLFLVEAVPVPVPNVGSRRALRRLTKLESKSTLDQRLTAKLYQWGIPFSLYNLTNRPPHPWQVRDLVPPSTPVLSA